MKVSIITPVYNNKIFVEHCMNSVFEQTYQDIEYIVIDGGSTDGTVDVINKLDKYISLWISEKDNGIYDAMNKGLNMATGDVIGILNSDDMYFDNNVIETVVHSIIKAESLSCYGDLIYVDKHDPYKIIRYWNSRQYERTRFRKGWMPPHPTFFVKRKVYQKYGLFNLEFPLAADYELMLRFLYKYRISTTYVSEVLVRMRVGGASNPGLTTLKAIRENYRAWKVNDLKCNPTTFAFKPLSKLFQYFPHKYVEKL